MKTTWELIRESLLRYPEACVAAQNRLSLIQPTDRAACCGLEFGYHVTYKGAWLPCDENRKKSWKRKLNREAKLRKFHEKMRAAGGSK